MSFNGVFNSASGCNNRIFNSYRVIPAALAIRTCEKAEARGGVDCSNLL